jgi:hypothetical protein
MRQNYLHASTQIVTLTFFHYRGVHKIWGMSQMQLAQKPLREAPGLNFYKLLGSGAGNGFSLKPDFSVYALLGVWNKRDNAVDFFKNSSIFNNFKKHSVERWTVFMRAVKAHGRWSGVEPFRISEPNDKNGLTAVLTRATIHPRLALKFWRNVPRASEDFPRQKGLIFAKGIGELPFVEQATFSLWQTKQDMIAYAYRDSRHTEVIKKTRSLSWYKEELFAQFQPIATEGTWNGANPLQNLLQTA